MTFDLDANGIVNVSAKDKATGKEQKITITASSGLSKDEVERMQKDAELHADEDKKRREEVETRNRADQAIYQAERMSVQGRAYKAQYGLDSVHLVLTNLYGPWDSYNPHRSHVVAALVRKFVEAKRASAAHVPLWGTGRPVREFLYVEDCADAIVEAADAYTDIQHPLNIGTGIGTSIKELAETIRDLTDFRGELRWEADKPDGQAMKILDPARARAALAWRPTHSLRDGLAKTIAWYDANKAAADARW